ncbi:MAG TPA: hypothetical protein VFH89_02345 [Sphingomicrobium sp.]|nr:hypothetical protein [Sphingomicrobium sp.]
MTPLGAFELLDVWEEGRAQSPVRRALLLLKAAWPEYDSNGWGKLSIGMRDQWLVALRTRMFGTHFELLADCPACGAALETGFHASDLPCLQPRAESYELSWDGLHVAYRLPTSDDLIDVLETNEIAAPDQAILARCVQAVRQNRRKYTGHKLSAELREHIEQAMAEQDIAAQIDVGLVCQACGHSFERRFDIVDHLWGEIGDWAERILADVHLLAGAYGWSEEVVLNLSPARRQHYIELLAA